MISAANYIVPFLLVAYVLVVICQKMTPLIMTAAKIAGYYIVFRDLSFCKSTIENRLKLKISKLFIMKCFQIGTFLFEGSKDF